MRPKAAASNFIKVVIAKSWQWVHKRIKHFLFLHGRRVDCHFILITTNYKVIMVKQFRFGTKEVTLEFPAGSIEAGESLLEAAKRELLEETGSVGASIVAIGNCKPNPAFLNNTCYHFVAHGAQINQKQNLDKLFFQTCY